VHIPAETIDTVVPTTVQTPGVLDVTATGSVDEALAVIATVPPAV
jgi:hypothetical protein